MEKIKLKTFTRLNEEQATIISIETSINDYFPCLYDLSYKGIKTFRRKEYDS